MIKCYGLHWRVDRVHWGAPGPGNPGTLLGSLQRGGQAKTVDFRQQRGIYALYADYELVYVGQTGAGAQRLFSRLKRHREDHLSERWNRFSWFGTQRVTAAGKLSQDNVAIHADIQAALNILEAISIAISEPRLNLQRGRWTDIHHYYQYRNAVEIVEDGDD